MEGNSTDINARKGTKMKKAGTILVIGLIFLLLLSFKGQAMGNSKNVKPDITNITRFSARPYTEAKSMKGRIKTEIVKQRSKILTDLCKEISKKNNIGHIGKKYNILITEIGKNKTFVGRTDFYKPVVIKEKVKIGDFVRVKIIDATSIYLVGSII